MSRETAQWLGVFGIALGVYHGWRRTHSAGWTAAWAVAGGAIPIVTIPLALAQGFGTPAR